jgi:hypothetical protein
VLAVAQFVALLTCAVFTGAAIYINIAEHPARMECGTRLAATVFGPSYRRAAAMQASLALFASLFGFWAWWLGGGLLWLLTAVLMAAAIAFTFLVIMPTNRKLLDPDLDRDSQQTRQLLVRWNRLHAVRSVMSAIALVSLATELTLV